MCYLAYTRTVFSGTCAKKTTALFKNNLWVSRAHVTYDMWDRTRGLLHGAELSWNALRDTHRHRPVYCKCNPDKCWQLANRKLYLLNRARRASRSGAAIGTNCASDARARLCGSRIASDALTSTVARSENAVATAAAVAVVLFEADWEREVWEENCSGEETRRESTGRALSDAADRLDIWDSRVRCSNGEISVNLKTIPAEIGSDKY